MSVADGTDHQATLRFGTIIQSIDSPVHTWRTEKNGEKSVSKRAVRKRVTRRELKDAYQLVKAVVVRFKP
jgi:hypothetical protein